MRGHGQAQARERDQVERAVGLSARAGPLERFGGAFVPAEQAGQLALDDVGHRPEVLGALLGPLPGDLGVATDLAQDLSTSAAARGTAPGLEDRAVHRKARDLQHADQHLRVVARHAVHRARRALVLAEQGPRDGLEDDAHVAEHRDRGRERLGARRRGGVDQHVDVATQHHDPRQVDRAAEAGVAGLEAIEHRGDLGQGPIDLERVKAARDRDVAGLEVKPEIARLGDHGLEVGHDPAQRSTRGPDHELGQGPRVDEIERTSAAQLGQRQRAIAERRGGASLAEHADRHAELGQQPAEPDVIAMATDRSGRVTSEREQQGRADVRRDEADLDQDVEASANQRVLQLGQRLQVLERAPTQGQPAAQHLEHGERERGAASECEAEPREPGEAEIDGLFEPIEP